MNEGQANKLAEQYFNLNYRDLNAELLKYNKEELKSILVALIKLSAKNREPLVVDYDSVAAIYSLRYGGRPEDYL